MVRKLGLLSPINLNTVNLCTFNYWLGLFKRSTTLSKNVHVKNRFLGRREDMWLARLDGTVGFPQKFYINPFALEKIFHFFHFCI